MITRNIQKHYIAAFATMLMIGAVQTSYAVLLAPVPIGTSAVPGINVNPGSFAVQGPSDFPGPGSVVAIYNFGPAVGATFTFQGTEIVWKENATGNLSFLFQVENLAGSSDAIQRVTVSGFGNYTTAVAFDNRGGINPGVPAIVGSSGDPLAGRDSGALGQSPRTADRFNSNTVGFQFASPNEIAQGTKSKWFVISTNAQLPIGAGMISAIDGSVAITNVLVPVPEPTSILFGIGLCGVMGLRKSRRSLRGNLVGG